MDKIRIGGIMQNAHLALLNVTAVPDRPGIAAAILRSRGERGVNVQFIVLPLRPVMGEAGSDDSTQEGAPSDRSFESTETHHRPAYPMTHTRAFTLGSDSSEGPEYH